MWAIINQLTAGNGILKNSTVGQHCHASNRLLACKVNDSASCYIMSIDLRELNCLQFIANIPLYYYIYYI